MNVSCPDCRSTAFKKNGYTRHGKQNHRCLDCGRQFSLETEEKCSAFLNGANSELVLCSVNSSDKLELKIVGLNRSQTA